LLSFAASPGAAQELEPRRWTHLPTDRNYVAGAYAYTDADIAFDPVLRIENAVMEMNTWSFGYIRTFELLDKSARFQIRQDWQDGHWTGLVDGVPTSIERQGWADTVARFAVNLIGAPPLAGRDFADYRAKTDVETIVGAALEVQLPTGEYMKDKLINLGSNRFTFRPQLGVLHNHHNWSFELTGSAAVYTKNSSFFNGSELEQDPLYALQTHITYTFAHGFWIAASGGISAGGQSTLNGIEKDDRKEDIAWALSAGFPVASWLAFKAAIIDSHRRMQVGNESTTFAVGLTMSL
jgi:hypothetical protein